MAKEINGGDVSTEMVPKTTRLAAIPFREETRTQDSLGETLLFRCEDHEEKSAKGTDGQQLGTQETAQKGAVSWAQCFWGKRGRIPWVRGDGGSRKMQIMVST